MKIFVYVVNEVVLCEVICCGVDDVIFVSGDGFVLEGLWLMLIVCFDGGFVMLLFEFGVFFGIM